MTCSLYKAKSTGGGWCFRSLKDFLSSYLSYIMLFFPPYFRSGKPLMWSATSKAPAIRIEKHLQCEKLLGLARGNTKNHGNKKSGESRTPIRYNVVIHYHSWQSIVNCQVHLSTSFHVTIIHGWTVYKSLCPVLGTCPLNITLTGLTLENQIAWKTVSEIIK